jgi:amino acid transporter
MADEIHSTEGAAPSSDAPLKDSDATLRELATTREEEKTLERFGYKQELSRTMGAFSAFALSFSGIGITAAVFSTIAFVWSQGGPAGIWTWPIASVFFVLLGLVFGEISTKVPLAGVSYQWVSRLKSAHFGFIVGLFAYIAFQVGVVSTDLVLAQFLLPTLGITPDQPKEVLVAVLAFIVQGGLLIGGLKIATKVNNVAVLTEIVGGFVTGLALLIWALVTHHHSFSYSFNTGEVGQHRSYFLPFIISFLLPIFTFSAWEAPADLAEETIKGTSTTPRAMVRAIVLTAVIGFVMLLGFTLGMPALKETLASADPGSLIVQNAFGSVISKLFLVVVDISIFATGIAILAMAARIIFSMARDGVVIGSTRLAKVNGKLHSPVYATVAVTIIAIAVTIIAQKLTLVSQVAATFYALVYLLVTASYLTSRNKYPSPAGSFTMGKWGRPIIVTVLAFLLFCVGSLTLPTINHKVALTALAFVALAIAIYFMSRSRIAKLEAERRSRSNANETRAE